MISGFCLDINEIFTLLGIHAALIGLLEDGTNGLSQYVCNKPPISAA
jgi:hypothetical protein